MADPRTYRLQVRLTPDERQLLEGMAASEGAPVGEWARERLLAAAGAPTPPMTIDCDKRFFPATPAGMRITFRRRPTNTGDILGDLWASTRGGRLTTDHAASSHGLPVCGVEPDEDDAE